APEGYAKAVTELCHRYDILGIADEVMCGAGRCGTWRALEHDGVVPDLMTVAKGLGAGYIPLGAALYSDESHRTSIEAHGGTQTGHTCTAHTAACASAGAVQKIIMRENQVERVRTRGATFQEEIRKALAHIPEVGDVRGRGYFIGVELVKDPETKEPFAPELRVHAEI